MESVCMQGQAVWVVGHDAMGCDLFKICTLAHTV